MEMPCINLEVVKTKLTPEQYNIVSDCFVNRGGNVRLRSSRPNKAAGATQYIWRMIAFIVSPNPQHHCMPIGADFYILDSEYAHRTDEYIPQYRYDSDRETVANWSQKTWDMMHRGEKRKKYVKEELDPIVDIIVEIIPKNQWYGAKRWSKAFYG
jgi:hypothetical protein